MPKSFQNLQGADVTSSLMEQKKPRKGVCPSELSHPQLFHLWISSLRLASEINPEAF